MNPRTPMHCLQAGVARSGLPSHWRSSGAGMLLPQGSILANWVLATLSSQGISSLPPGVPRDMPTGLPDPQRPGGDRLGHLCRKLGQDPADDFLRAILASHHARGGWRCAAQPTDSPAPRSAARDGATVHPLLLADVLREVSSLPSLPALVLDLLASLEDAEVEVDALARKIVLDQVLTARTLRVANSSFYGRQRKVATVGEAITVLGLHGLRNLALTATLMERLPGAGAGVFCFRGFWRHAIGTALCARALAARAGLNREQAYTAGLLHDIGRLVLATRFRTAYDVAMACRALRDCSVVDAENEALGLDHALVGEALARHWKFPDFVQQAVAQHHALAPGAVQPMALVVHVADALTQGLDLSGDAGAMVPPVAAPTWEHLGLDMAALVEVLDEVGTQFEAACSVLAA